MEKEQGKLIIIVSVVFAMVLLCMICTSDSVPEVKSLQECTPDAVSVLDDGRELYDLNWIKTMMRRTRSCFIRHIRRLWCMQMGS